MLRTAASWLNAHAPSVRLAQVDAAALPFNRAFDVVFSAATFHWIADHAALFRSIVMSLRRGGRLKAQCGGGPNLALLLARTDGLMSSGRFAPYFSDWRDPWFFADVEGTRRRLAAAGFADVDVGLEPAPVTFDTPRAFMEFIRTVCVRHHLERLPSDERSAFVQELTVRAAADDPPFTLDYWRLNIAARRPA
jgi:trans-aconitate 2-methyltransferase